MIKRSLATRAESNLTRSSSLISIAGSSSRVAPACPINEGTYFVSSYMKRKTIKRTALKIPMVR